MIFHRLHATIANSLRPLRGRKVRAVGPRPQRTLELFEFEACPFCKKVREVMTELDLSYIGRPCAKGAERNRTRVRRLGGKEQFPMLVDTNASRVLYESDDIIAHLWERYGDGHPLPDRLSTPLHTVGAMASSIVRSRGSRLIAGAGDRAQPEELLLLYNVESSPDCRIVRERLTSLDLDVEVRNAAPGGPTHEEMMTRSSGAGVPYLVDPNAAEEIAGAKEIVDHLDARYGATA